MPVTRADELDARPADNAKELLALADRLDRAIAIDKGDREFTCEDAGYFSILRAFYPKQIAAMSDALRLSARQQASAEEVARTLDPSAFVDLGPGFKRAQKIEMELVALKASALLAKYDVFKKVEG